MSVSLIGLVTMLAVLKKNCNLSDSAINKVIGDNNLFKSVVQEELNLSEEGFGTLVSLITAWETSGSLDVFSFGKES
jgi:hypothetical protein